jgi:Ca2+-binding RTX toxin-like protein
VILLGGGEKQGIDIIFDLGGRNIINGGECDDFIVGGSGNDTISGGDKDDQIYDTGGTNLLMGKVDNDYIETNAQSTVEGGDGCDICVGGQNPLNDCALFGCIPDNVPGALDCGSGELFEDQGED